MIYDSDQGFRKISCCMETVLGGKKDGLNRNRNHKQFVSWYSAISGKISVGLYILLMTRKRGTLNHWVLTSTDMERNGKEVIVLRSSDSIITYSSSFRPMGSPSVGSFVFKSKRLKKMCICSELFLLQFPGQHCVTIHYYSLFSLYSSNGFEVYGRITQVKYRHYALFWRQYWYVSLAGFKFIVLCQPLKCCNFRHVKNLAF